MATKWYAEQILEAGCAMVNCMPVFIAREAYWQRRFEEAGVPIIGDDIKSQVGATITHRVLTSLFRERGVHLDKTMQLNVGGNSDFLNMLERERLESKKISKTNAVTSMLDYDLGERNVHVGPSDYVPWLTDRKWAYIRMEGSAFGDVPLNVELKLEVWDSPNSAGIVIDAVRMAKLALNNGISGALEGPSSYLMKSPPKQIVDDEAYDAVEKFIKQNAREQAEGRREMRIAPPLLAGGGGLFSIAALVAIVAVLSGEFGETQRRILGTSRQLVRVRLTVARCPGVHRARHGAAARVRVDRPRRRVVRLLDGRRLVGAYEYHVLGNVCGHPRRSGSLVGLIGDDVAPADVATCGCARSCLHPRAPRRSLRARHGR